MFAVIGVQLFKVGNYFTSLFLHSRVQDPIKIWSEFPHLSLELSLTCHTTDCGVGTRLARFVELSLSSIYSCIMLTHKQAPVFPTTLSIPNFNVFLLHWTQTHTHKHIMYTSHDTRHDENQFTFDIFKSLAMASATVFYNSLWQRDCSQATSCGVIYCQQDFLPSKSF